MYSRETYIGTCQSNRPRWLHSGNSVSETVWRAHAQRSLINKILQYVWCDEPRKKAHALECITYTHSNYVLAFQRKQEAKVAAVSAIADDSLTSEVSLPSFIVGPRYRYAINKHRDLDLARYCSQTDTLYLPGNLFKACMARIYPKQLESNDWAKVVSQSLALHQHNWLVLQCLLK